MGVFNLDEETRFLAEVTKQIVPYDLCRTLTPSFQGLRISRELEDEAVLAIELILADASRICEETGCGSRIKTL